MYDETKGDLTDLAGTLLLAHPHLKDSNFVRSVILMTTHEEEGSLGVVLNKSADLVLGEVNSEFIDYGLGQVPLFNGGPVATDQIILAGWELLVETNQFRLSFGMNPEVAQRKMQECSSITMRAFRGYSGWEPGQLADELEANAWVLSEMNGEAITEMEGDRLWKHLIMEINPELGLLSYAPSEESDN